MAKSEEGRTVYHMGDTDHFGDMALINKLYMADIGIVPIGDRFTMDACAADLVCDRIFKFKTVFPCHYATLQVCSTPMRTHSWPK